MGWRLEHTYAELPQLFYRDASADRGPRAAARRLQPAARDDAGARAGCAGESGRRARSSRATRYPRAARPIAQAYAGHQFGHFTSLGDGRAILLGEQITPSGERVDIQLKGAGQTRFSRRGDGRAALGPMLREYIISEAMHALGIPTTRSLAVVTTGEPVYRETVLEGAVLTRVAASHIRVGTMQWAAAHEDAEALRALSDYTRARHYPELADVPGAASRPLRRDPRTASAPDRPLAAGRLHPRRDEHRQHGALRRNDRLRPVRVHGHLRSRHRVQLDRPRRTVRVQNQPPIAQWNLARLAEAMLPLFEPDVDRAIERATSALDRFPDLFEQHWLTGMRSKLGLFTEEPEDKALADRPARLDAAAVRRLHEHFPRADQPAVC